MNTPGPERDDVRTEPAPGEPGPKVRHDAGRDTSGPAATRDETDPGKRSLGARMPWRTRGHRHPEESWWSFGVLVTVAAVIVLALIAWLVLF